jgi:hypothetical protein
MPVAVTACCTVGFIAAADTAMAACTPACLLLAAWQLPVPAAGKAAPTPLHSWGADQGCCSAAGAQVPAHQHKYAAQQGHLIVVYGTAAINNTHR